MIYDVPPSLIPPSPLATAQQIHLPREKLIAFDSALQYEWLVTNGIGGYASSTALGTNTRRYHGLLVAALRPPLGRTLLVSRLHEEVDASGDVSSISTVEYHDGTVHPAGYLFLEDFQLIGTLPLWRYRVRDVELHKILWMDREANTVYIRYYLTEAPGAITLRIDPFVTYRDYHQQTQGSLDWHISTERADGGYNVQVGGAPNPIRIFAWPETHAVETGLWYWKHLHRRERERGLDFLEDLYTPLRFPIRMEPGSYATLVFSAEEVTADSLDPDSSLQAELDRQASLIEQSVFPSGDPFGRRLTLAADQFLVRRQAAQVQTGRSAIAGYHWFGGYGRDALVALAGLCLPTRRYSEARQILATFSHYLDQGILPNTFAEHGEEPEYNTSEAALWYFEAIARYLDATADFSLLEEQFDTLAAVIDWHLRATHHGIGVDPTDSLLRAGAPGLALTWMDAKVGDWVVTPRGGKCVEVNALWYNALMLMAEWSQRLGRPDARFQELAAQVQAGFNQRFWNDEAGCCFDVVDGEYGNDPSIRPNQLFAIGLRHPVLAQERWEAALTTVERELVTPFGLRTLAPTDQSYVATYGGDQYQRDRAYHQGTIWPWLIGVYCDAAWRVRGEQFDPGKVIAAFPGHLGEAGLGTISEIFDAAPPHDPNGCIARVWSVAEVLRIWQSASRP